MIGELNQKEIETLLESQPVGRIGCRDGNMVYIVPLSYAYDGNNVYARSLEGTKIDMMRQHPDICFEVDDTSDMANWRSVIAWGRFEELQGAERLEALKTLLRRRLPLSSSTTTHIGEHWPFSESELEKLEGVVFSIPLRRKTGRFEQTSAEGPNLD